MSGQDVPGAETSDGVQTRARASGSDDDTTSGLIEELRALARSRSAVQFDDTPAPLLDDIVRSRGCDAPAGRQRVIDGAIADIGYAQYQESARTLLGSDTDRWQPLAQRGEIAAAQFGITYDGFRRARTTTPSLLDQTLSVLARAVMYASTPADPVDPVDPVASSGPAEPGPDGTADPSPADPSPADLSRSEPSRSEPRGSGREPSADPAGATEPRDQPGAPPEGPTPVADAPGAHATIDDDGESPDRRRSRAAVARILVGASALIVLAAVVVALVALRSDDTDHLAQGSATTAPTSPPQLAQPVGDDIGREAPCAPAAPDASADPDLEPYVEVIAQHTTAIVAEPTNGCPVGSLQKWGAFVFQQFATADGSNSGVLATTVPSEAIWFTDAQWGSYHQVGGKSGDNAQELMGLARAPEERDRYVVIPTDTDAILVGGTPESPHFFLLGPARAVWERDGGAGGPLGLPTSNPVVIGGALTQDFEGGYLEQLADASVVTRLVPDPRAGLPPLDKIRDKILRHADATSWYVAPDGRRYWIPNGEVWECLGGAGSQVDNDIRGYAIATLPYGGSARC